jgi:hypothetical protein
MDRPVAVQGKAPYHPFCPVCHGGNDAGKGSGVASTG